MVRATGFFETTSDAFEFPDNVLDFHTLDKGRDTAGVAGASVDETGLEDYSVFYGDSNLTRTDLPAGLNIDDADPV